MRLKDRVVLVTGGASGIGLATARLARDEGARVVVADLTGPDDGSPAASADGAPGAAPRDQVPDIAFARCDITDAEAVAALLDGIMATAGRLDVVVNNAGVLGLAPFDEVSPALWNQVMTVNAAAPFFLVQASVARFPGLAAIVNVASTSAFVAGRDQAAYEASKAAVVMMTRSLALALAPRGIRVNAVAPGLVDTPLTRRLFGSTERFEARVREKIPLGRAARPDEIAETIVFLASDDAAYMTGETLVADGGWLLV